MSELIIGIAVMVSLALTSCSKEECAGGEESREERHIEGQLRSIGCISQGNSERRGRDGDAGSEVTYKEGVKIEGPSPGRMRVILGNVHVSGALERRDVAESIKKNEHQVRRCCEEALQREPSVGGKVGMSISISSSGDVTEVRILEDTVVSSGYVGRCIAAAAENWKLPAPKSGDLVLASFGWVLRYDRPSVK